MKKQLFTLAAIALISSGVKAQSDSAKHGQETKAEKRLSKGQSDRTTIVISGEKVTVNGEEIEDLRGKLKGIDGRLSFNDTRRLMPGLRVQLHRQGPQLKNNNRQNFTWLNHSNKAMLGVSVEKNEKGARITDIVTGSGAEKAGLRKDDIITAIGTTPIASGDALVKTIQGYKPEETVEITLLRNGKEKKLTATLGMNDRLNSIFHWDDPDFSLPEAPSAFGWEGGSQSRLQLNSRPRFGFGIQDNEADDGAVVTHVKEESIAAKAGLQVNDIITEAAGTPVKTTADLKRILSGNKDYSAIDFKISRDGKSKNLTLKVPKRIQSAEL